MHHGLGESPAFWACSPKADSGEWRLCLRKQKEKVKSRHEGAGEVQNHLQSVVSKLKESLRRCFAANGVMPGRRAHEVVLLLCPHSPAL